MSNRVSDYQNSNSGKNFSHPPAVELSNAVQERMAEVQHKVAATGEQVVNQLTSFVKKRPGLALGTAVAAGLLVGYLAKRK